MIFVTLLCLSLVAGGSLFLLHAAEDRAQRAREDARHFESKWQTAETERDVYARDAEYWHKLHDQLLGRRSRRQPETPAPLPENAP